MTGLMIRPMRVDTSLCGGFLRCASAALCCGRLSASVSVYECRRLGMLALFSGGRGVIQGWGVCYVAGFVVDVTAIALTCH